MAKKSTSGSIDLGAFAGDLYNDLAKMLGNEEQSLKENTQEQKNNSKARNNNAEMIEKMNQLISQQAELTKKMNDFFEQQTKKINEQTKAYKEHAEAVKQSGKAQENLQATAQKKTYSNKNRTLTTGFDLNPDDLQKTTITSSGVTNEYLEKGIIKVRELNGEVSQLQPLWTKVNKEIANAETALSNVKEAISKNSTATEEQKSIQGKLNQAIENYRKSVEGLKISSKEGGLSLSSNMGDFQQASEGLKTLVEEAKTATENLNNTGNSLEDVKRKLQEIEGLDFDSFKKIGKDGNVTKYRDDLGRILTVTKEVTATGLDNYVYKVNDKFGKLVDSVEQTYNGISRLHKGIDTLKNTAETRLAADLKEQIDGVYDSLQKLEVQITKAENAGNTKRVNELTKEYGKQRKELKQLEEQYKEVNAQIRNQGGWMLNLKDSWTKAMRSFTTYISVTTVFYQAARAIRSMINEVKELDASLTEFKKVSDLTGDSLERYIKKAYEMGDAVAKTGREMIEAATEFKKSGFSDQDSLKLGQIANLYTNIADEEISAGEAASFIIAQMKAFKIEANDAIRVVDALNEVSNNYAVSSAELATAIGKVSSTMAAGNTTYEQTLGMLTAITEITRNSSKAANALKTIGQRIRGVGEDGEDASEYVAALQGQFDKLGINVKIVKNSAGEMESTYNILKAMAEKWNDLTDAERQSIGELAAGKNRITEFNALMSNWATAVDATNTAMESNGSASRENERVLDSIQGHIQRLNSEWEKLSRNLVKSSWIKNVLNVATGLLKFLNTGIGKLVIRTTAMTAALKLATNALTKYIIKQKIQNLETKKMTNSQSTLKGSFKALGEYLSILTNKTKLETNAKKAQILVNKKLAASQLALNVIIAAASFLYQAAVRYFERQKEKLEEMSEASQEAAESMNELNTKFDELDEDFYKNLEKYKNTLDDTSASTEEMEEANEGLAAIQKRINELFGDNKLDVYQNDIDDTKKKIDELIESEIQLYRTKNDSARQDAVKMLKEDVGSRSGMTIGHGSSKVEQRGFHDILGDILTSGDYGSTNFGFGGAHTYLHGNAQDVMKFLNEAYNYIKDNREKLKEQYGYSEEDLDSLLKQLSEKYNNLEKIYQNHIDFLEKYYDTMLKYSKNKSSYEKDMADAASDGVLSDEEIQNILDKYPDIKEVVDDIGYSYDALREKFGVTAEAEKELDNETQNTTEVIKKKIIAMEKLQDQFTELQSAYDSIQSAIDEFNKTGELSISTMKSLMDTGAWEYLDYTNGKIQLNNKALKDQENILKSNMLATLQDSYAKDVLALSEGNIESMTKGAQAALKGQETDLINTDDLAKAAAGSLFGVAEAEAALGLAKGTLDINAYNGQLKKLNDYYNKVAKSISSLKIKSSKNSSGSSGDTKSAWEKELEKLNNQYKNSEITIEQYITKLEKLRKKYKKNKEAVKELDAAIRNAKLEKLEDDYKRGLISIEDYIAGLKELQKEFKKGTKEWNNFADKIKKGLETLVKDKSSDMKRAQDAAVQLIEDELENLDKLKDETEKYYDDLIAAKEKANDETERELELARLQEALENARNNKTKRVYVQGLGWQWMADEEAIADAQKALDDFNNEEEIRQLEEEKEAAVAALEEQISSLEEYRDKWKEIVDDYEKEKDRLILIEQMGASSEEDILNQRIEILEQFRDKYLAILRDIDTLDNATADDVANGNVDLETVEGYAEGGVVDYTGLAKLHGSANKPEVVLSNAQAANLYSMLKTPQFSSKKFGGAATQIYNFDNLVLPNVSNARQFLNELRTITNINKNL